MKWNTESVIKMLKESFQDCTIKRQFHKGEFDSTHLVVTLQDDSHFEVFGERDDNPMYKNRENVVIDRVILERSSSKELEVKVIEILMNNDMSTVVPR